MSQLPREELAAILFEEVEGYLPRIGKGLSTLQKSGDDWEVMQEVFRIFHNIKGAASQVDFSELSAAAARSENLLAANLEEHISLSAVELNFLYGVHDSIDEFCSATDKSKDAEIEHFKDILSSGYGRHTPEQTSFYEDDMFEADWTSVTSEPDADAVSELDTIRLECLNALRSVLPLLQELADCSVSENVPALVPQFISPMSRAVSTLATCSQTAGLNGQHRLLTNFHTLLETLGRTPSLISADTPALLKEFLTYLDVIFSLDPREGEAVVGRIQDKFTALSDLLISGGDADQDVSIDDDFIDETEIDEIFNQQEEILFEETADPESYAGPSIEEELYVEEAPASVEAEARVLSDEEKELFAIFQAECEEHLQVINSTLNSLEGSVVDAMTFTPDLLNTVSQMRRSVHTLKGAAGMTGFDYLSSCAHSLEDLLDWLHDDSDEINPDDVLVIADGIDIIERLSEDTTGQDRTSAEIYSEKIETYLNTRSSASADAASESPLPQPVPANTIQQPEIPATVESHQIAAAQPEADTALPGTAGNVRVKLDDLDELAGIEGELVVARGSIEKLMEQMNQSLIDLNSTREALNRKTQELEVGFEAQSLYGFGPAPIPGAQSIAEEPTSTLSEFDPIELDRYSQLNLIIRSLNEIAIDVNAIHSEMNSVANEIKGQVSKQQLSMGVMQEKLMRIRMTPLSSISRILYRTVRQTANNLEKDVKLTITGEDVYMDRFIWSKTLDPLMHILRNCIDHGIEDSFSRLEAGKPKSGSIHINAEQKNRYVAIRITDDGRGIDIDKMKAKLSAENILQEGVNYPDEELLRHLFRPSFSTKEDISQISGRGVGLDVVLRNIQELRGSVKIENSPGQGVAFELNIPITLSINRAIVITVGGRQFAVPIQDIVEVHKSSKEELAAGNDNQLKWGENIIEKIQLAPRLQLESFEDDETFVQNLMLIIEADGTHKALQIDSVIEQREIVIKDLGSHLRYVRGINGVTVTGDGTVIPILNLLELAAQESLVVKTVEREDIPVRETPLQVLIVDDSISVRYSIARMVEGQSWQAHQAVDGIDAMEQLESLTPDVIVLDIEMPRMNGYEFLAARVGHDKLSSIPVVMLTSRASEKHRKKAEELGVDSYVTKPYQEDEFVELLKSMAVSHL
ncbi:Hpt domain-containing protein [Desulfopila sp. IMCC35008]|uniref:hybrid sensor histidine kinase/response regulator n=1 Tax=Desulfopila sp. IMCC35008 TaxID=2653858 RepID=UPI0013D1AE7E|nr:Hpt domain-containing protein [Desulfopila sp. IMCC35008]